MKNILKINPLASTVFAYAAAGALQKGISFLLFMWFAYVLSPDAYAQFGLLMALQTGITTLAGAGIVETVIGKLKEHESPVARRELYRCANLSFVLLGLVSSVLVCAVYAAFFRSQNWSAIDLLSVVAGGLLIALFAVQSNLVRLDEKHGMSVGLSFLPPLLGVFAGYVLFLLDHSVSSFFIGTAAGLFASFLISKAVKVGVLELPENLAHAKPIIIKLAPFVLICALGWAGGYGNTYIVEAFFSSSEVAKFTFAYTLSSIMQLVASSLNQVWSPRFFGQAHNTALPELERRNRRFYAMQGGVLGLAGLGVLLVVPVATGFIGGNLAVYGGMTFEIALLFAAYALCIPWYHAQNYFLAHEKGAELMQVTITSSLIGFTLLALSVWTFGAIGVYLGYFAQTVTRSCIVSYRARRYWPISLLWEGIVIALMLLAVGAIAAHFVVIPSVPALLEFAAFRQ